MRYFLCKEEPFFLYRKSIVIKTPGFHVLDEVDKLNYQDVSPMPLVPSLTSIYSFCQSPFFHWFTKYITHRISALCCIRQSWSSKFISNTYTTSFNVPQLSYTSRLLKCDGQSCTWVFFSIGWASSLPALVLHSCVHIRNFCKHVWKFLHVQYLRCTGIYLCYIHI